MRSEVALSILAGAFVAGTFAACVGDDPGTAEPANDGGGSETAPIEEASTGIDAPGDDGGCKDTSCDPKNCGRPNHDCLGGACLAGVCQPVVLASGLKHPTHLVLDGNTLFWVNTGGVDAGCNDVADGSVMSIRTDGTNQTTIATGLACPIAVGVLDTKVYWAEISTAANNFVSYIKRANRDGSSPERVQGPGQLFNGMLIEGGQLFFLSSIPNSSGTLYKTQPTPDAGLTAVVQIAARPSSFIFDDKYLYYTEDNTGAAWRVDKNVTVGVDGGKLRLGGNQSLPIGISVKNGVAYWINRSASTLMRYDPASATETTIASGVSPGGGGRRTATDGTHVYTTGVYNNVLRVPLTGVDAGVEKVAASGANGIVVTDDAVYLTFNNGAGSVVRVAKP